MEKFLRMNYRFASAEASYLDDGVADRGLLLGIDVMPQPKLREMAFDHARAPSSRQINAALENTVGEAAAEVANTSARMATRRAIATDRTGVPRMRWP